MDNDLKNDIIKLLNAIVVGYYDVHINDIDLGNGKKVNWFDFREIIIQELNNLDD